MKTRHLLSLGLAALFVYLVGPGCTQDFGAFQPCEVGQKPCDDGCHTLQDPTHGCAAVACDPCAIPNAAAACVLGNSSYQCAVGTCLEGHRNCDGLDANGCEVDPDTDPLNCGACGNKCVTPHATPACDAGQCAIDTCDEGFGDCSGGATDGCESDLQNDPEHCGDCATQCGQDQSCQAGKCTLQCPPDKGDCNSDPSDGCETDLGTGLNCAFCGDKCDLPNAAAQCQAGMCVVQSCANGFGDCDGMAANGCEADTKNSALTCGTCDNACPNGPNGTTVCNNGTCGINCDAGFANCDGQVATGCETDLNSDVDHCGGCNSPCSPANGVGVCNGGQCAVQMCNGTFADCDMGAANGCEINTATSAQNCGMCGKVCIFAHAQANCAAGNCQLGNCNAGFGNCNSDPADGCELPTTADVNNCGGCGNVCPGGPGGTAVCTNGVCAIACDAGFGDCDNDASNGCETALDNSVQNCGACGHVCQTSNGAVASLSCSGGLCSSACDIGRANCSYPSSPAQDDGCELNASNSSTNCGGCGNACTAQGNPQNPLQCVYNAPGVQNLCGCFQNSQCDGDGPGGPAQGSCNNGLCSCNGTACASGEACASQGGVNVCSCAAAGGAACAAGETCCVSPAGCKNLRADPLSCGACGHACTEGFICFDLGVNAAPECRCDAALDCNAGTSGTFACSAAGRCVCGGQTCGVGERCQANGQCG
ncbi:MAG: hypothetical protein U0441_06590 [Polyangiaceae bacterium]